MILTTHAITGAAIASTMPNHPIVGFVLGFGSHFLLDSIPHWDYKLGSISEDKENPMNTDIKINKTFIFDLSKIASDGLIGLILSLYIFAFVLNSQGNSSLILATFAGAIGGMLPDALQFVYFKFRREPLVSLQKFHMFIHTKVKLNSRPLIGITSQILIILCVVALTWLLNSK